MGKEYCLRQIIGRIKYGYYFNHACEVYNKNKYRFEILGKKHFKYHLKDYFEMTWAFGGVGVGETLYLSCYESLFLYTKHDQLLIIFTYREDKLKGSFVTSKSQGHGTEIHRYKHH